jgi:putative (di)nucleoside polyphosphate hydrolase|tara:strand:- start:19867 stop:20481 length:615 start_codon:yes stop_codon:yes gene_type:complete
VIDADGFRSNVGIILSNQQGGVFWARRFGQDSWQFPQGGIQSGESPEQAMYRELKEEVGLEQEHVSILGCSKGWLRYRLPKRLVRRDSRPVCVGQKQKWFLLSLTSDEKHVELDTTSHPEFDGWQWVTYWYPLREVVSFKRDVYRRALGELAPLLFDRHVDQAFNEAERRYAEKKANRRRDPARGQSSGGSGAKGLNHEARKRR